MDGFAVRHADVAGAGRYDPRELPVIGYVQAGALPDRDLQPGTAIRIMTGAPIPPGADAVVPFEDTDEVERKASGNALDRIRILQEAPLGANVRPAGEDLRTGERLMGHGDVLRPGEIGVLASVGRQRVTTLRRPIIAILSTGDELLAPGEAPGGGKIYDSNSFSIAAAVRRYGGEPWMLGIARDTMEDTARKLGEGIAADMLITTAGVSKGDYDFIKDVLTANGEIAFWSVRMRPARPLAFGVLHAPQGRRVPHIGLPGNPVSALVAFEQFCRPAILKMLGRTTFAKPQVRATLRDPHHQHGRAARIRPGHRHVGGRPVVGVADGGRRGATCSRPWRAPTASPSAPKTSTRCRRAPRWTCRCWTGPRMPPCRRAATPTGEKERHAGTVCKGGKGRRRRARARRSPLSCLGRRWPSATSTASSTPSRTCAPTTTGRWARAPSTGSASSARATSPTSTCATARRSPCPP